MKAIGYVRVSMEKQADFGVSVEAQSEKVRSMAVMEGLELVKVIVDACESAKSLSPGVARLASFVDARAVNAVIIAELAGWVSNAGSQIMTAASQWERQAIGERTRDAMHHKRADGEPVGTVPFGHRVAADGSRLEADPAEQGILSRIRELKAAGHTTRQIADDAGRHGASSTSLKHYGRHSRSMKKRTAKTTKAGPKRDGHGV